MLFRVHLWLITLAQFWLTLPEHESARQYRYTLEECGCTLTSAPDVLSFWLGTLKKIVLESRECPHVRRD
ncbi:MAG: hypothetical protein JWN70_2716 [Planctomycetaceae bacterium]|nr:hypothetical protein [Planctomycetaceae bacterium]